MPAYASQYGCCVLAMALNKYVYVGVNTSDLCGGISVAGELRGSAKSAHQLRTPILREALLSYGIETGLTVVSIGDVPPRTGLGSSGAFTVALIYALRTLMGIKASPSSVAEEAFHIERNLAVQPVGWQDHYMASFGGLSCIEMEPSGPPVVSRVRVPPDLIQRFEECVLLFYTRIKRDSREILSRQDDATTVNDHVTVSSLHETKSVGERIRQALESGDLEAFGELLQEHWAAKKRRSESVSSDRIDDWYETALANGAVGGKVIGAGGGGFLLFYCRPGFQNRLRAALSAKGLREVLYHFEPKGVLLLGDDSSDRVSTDE